MTATHEGLGHAELGARRLPVQHEGLPVGARALDEVELGGHVRKACQLQRLLLAGAAPGGLYGAAEHHADRNGDVACRTQ